MPRAVLLALLARAAVDTQSCQHRGVRVALLVSMQLVGCGRINFDDTSLIGLDAVAVDAVAVGTGPWGAPVRLFGAPGPFDDASQTGDGLDLFVNANNDLMSVARLTASQPWSDPVSIAELAGISATQPFVRLDALELYFSTSGTTAMLVSRRATRSAGWGAPVPAPELDAVLVGDIALRADGLEGVVSAGAPSDLSLMRRSSLTAPWVPSDPLVVVNGNNNDSEACLAEYGLALYFGSNRSGGAIDLYRSVRVTLDDPFGAPVPLIELNTVDEESDPWVSEDGHTLYFTSDRDGDRQIWMSTR